MGSDQRWRARMLMTTSAEWTPSASASNASRLDRGQSVGEHRGEDFDHLPVAVVGTRLASLRRTRSSAAGSTQSLERLPHCAARPACAPESAHNARIVDRLAPAVAAAVFGHRAVHPGG